jgi:hypothetical protein
VTPEDYGAVGDANYLTGEGTDNTQALRDCLATGRTLIIRADRLYRKTGELEIVHTGQVIKLAGAGAYGYGTNTAFLPELDARGGILDTAAIPKRIRTRRLHRADASDPQDAPLSASVNIQAAAAKWAVPLYKWCDYSDGSPTNEGPEIDVAIFNGCRTAIVVEPHVFGYYGIGICHDVTQDFGLPRFPDLNGNEYPNELKSSNIDHWAVIGGIIRGSRRAIVVLGAKPAAGEDDYGPQYYDAVAGELEDDSRGSSGASNGLIHRVEAYSTEHHSRRRRLDPTLDGGVLTQAGSEAEPEDAPCVLQIDGLAGNAEAALWNITVSDCRIATGEIFRVRLGRASRIRIRDTHIEGRNGSILTTTGAAVDTNDYTLGSYGHIATTSKTGSVHYTGTTSVTHNDSPFKACDYFTQWSDRGTLFMDAGNRIEAHNGELDLRAAEDEKVRLRSGANTALQVDLSGVQFGAVGPRIIYGNGSPEGVVTADPSSVYHQEDGLAGTTLWVKETGTGNVGWARVTTSSRVGRVITDLTVTAGGTTTLHPNEPMRFGSAIPDDGVLTIDMGGSVFNCLLTICFNTETRGAAMFHVRAVTGSSYTETCWIQGTTIERVGATELLGTTGNDTKITVSSIGSKIFIENRFGSTSTVTGRIDLT